MKKRRVGLTARRVRSEPTLRALELLVVQRPGKVRGSGGRDHFWAGIFKKTSGHLEILGATHKERGIMGYRKRSPSVRACALPVLRSLLSYCLSSPPTPPGAAPRPPVKY